MFQPGVTVGILGGGQLGRMTIVAGGRFGLRFRVLDPDPEAVSAGIADEFVQGKFTDYDAVLAFGRACDVVTIEIENVNVEALEVLASEGIPVYPSPAVIRTIRDKGLQKIFYDDVGIPTQPFAILNQSVDIAAHRHLLPGFQKMRTSGYDGKGVRLIPDLAAVSTGFDGPSVLEKAAEIAKEISVIVARSSRGEMVNYEPVEMVFDPDANLVDNVLAPASLSATQSLQAIELARKVAERLEVVGVLAVEMFLCKDGEIRVNESAPRPHNSGHHTIEGCVTSQFEQHLRAILGWPLGATTPTAPAVGMVNLLGDVSATGPTRYAGIDVALRQEGAYLHLYGKKETRPYRKMGHITLLGKDRGSVLTILNALKSKIKVGV